MSNKYYLNLIREGKLKKGTKVKMRKLKGFEDFIEIDDAYIKKARFGEIEDDWAVIIIDGKTYDTMWIDEIKAM